ncbi:MAG: CHY-type zinc finger protein [archaeon]|nr:CHY-type zinc finger protein [archaeon]
MCKHVLNAQVSIRAACCKKWFDCAGCHAATADHELKKCVEMVLACKKCRKVFRIDSTDFDADCDSFCPGCDNQFYLFAKSPEEPGIMIGFEGSVDMIRDDRSKTRAPGLHADPRAAPAPLFTPPASSSGPSYSFKL